MHPLRAESLFPKAFQLSQYVILADHQSHTFWGLIFLLQDPLAREPNVGLGPLPPWGGTLHLLLFSHLWVAYTGVWVLTILCLHPSYPTHCSSFFIPLIVENISASLEVVLVDSCSVNDYNFGVPMARRKLRVFLILYLDHISPKVGFLYPYAVQQYMSVV